MKITGILFFSVIIFFLSTTGFSQEKDIREDMVVINIEVPVRVMFKGKPVDNLKKSDFRLYENRKQIDINGFNIVRKKISSQKIELDSERKQFYKPRLFILAFSVTNFNRFYKKGVNYFFENVLRKEDKLLVFVNNTTLSYNDLNDKNKVLNEIISVLKKEGKISRKSIRSSIMTVENGIRNLMSQLGSVPVRNAFSRGDLAEQSILSFFVRYHMAWKAYKRSFLTLNIYTLYNFAAFLKRVKMEKWVISFYQYEKFPVLDENSDNVKRIKKLMGLESRRILRDVVNEFKANRTFPYEEVSKMYCNLGTTFNLVVIPTRIETDSAEVKAGDISTAAEVTLREIAKRTGGSVNFSTDLKNSIEKIVKKEDIQYLLTYAPEDSTKRGKLKIRLNKKKYKVFYDDNQKADFIERQLKNRSEKEKIVKLESLQFLNKKLFFKLTNFKRENQQKISAGKIKINIIIKDTSGKIIFDEEKVINPKKTSTDMLIGFNWLEQGKYDLIIDVTDLLTNRKVFEYLKLDVK